MVQSVPISLVFMIKELSHHVPCYVHLPQTIGVFQLLSSIVSANYFETIYATDNL